MRRLPSVFTASAPRPGVSRLVAVAAVAFAAAVAGCGAEPGPATPTPDERSYVVIVSMDGMRFDMPDRVPTPAFDRLAGRGVRAEGLIPSFPSKTFPNHYTLATGLYPGNHGIVDNAFYDPAFDATYRLGDNTVVTDGRWYGGEPIWVTAERQGVKAASFFWVGSEAEIDGVRPTYWKAYDGSVPYDARVDTVLAWLGLPLDRRPQLVMLYFSEPDHAGHDHGPDDPAVDSVVVELDALLGRLLDGIAALPIAGRTHLVVVSDHGMGPTATERVLFLDDFAELDGVRVVNNSTQAMLYFDGDDARLWAVYEALGERIDHASVYLREETPQDWHYRDSRRVGDIVVTAEPGWVIRMREWGPGRAGGTHGWDPTFAAMQGIFFAAGPELADGVVLPPFRNIHVYPLLARLLDLEPAAGIDGSLEPFRDVLMAPATP